VFSSCVKLFELGEMAVVVCELEPVLLCARKNQKIGERNSHTGCPSAISESNGALPDRCRNLVIREEGFITSECFSLGIASDTSRRRSS
jgi:hypothetical protein